MGKYASIHGSSTIRQAIRMFVLSLLVPAIVIGCRGPWFQKTDGLDALVVTEKGESRTPRPFASSRLRPASDGASRNTAPNPNAQSQTISDEDDEESVGDDLPAGTQDLLRRQIEAVKKIQQEGDGDLLAKKEPSANFKMSDDEESSSFENEPVAPEPLKTKINQPSESFSDKSEEQPSKPYEKLRERARDRSETKEGNSVFQKLKTPEAKQPLTQLEVLKYPVVNAEAVEDADAAVENKIKIETAKNDWRSLGGEMLASMQAYSDSEATLSPHQKLAIEFKKRLLSVILDDLEGAMTPIDNLQVHEQEFVQHECQAMFAITDPQGNPVLNRRWTLALQSHRKAQMSLAVGSNLEIQNATFCTEVDSFGILSKFPQYHFRQNQELLLYCELDNFVSTPVKDGYETQLQGSYEILDSNGRRVADQLLPPDEHICRNQRRDYFIAYRIYTPQDIKPGRYTLKLTIEDMKGHKFGQTNVDFQIVQ